jgi:hypothetical protein
MFLQSINQLTVAACSKWDTKETSACDPKSFHNGPAQKWKMKIPWKIMLDLPFVLHLLYPDWFEVRPSLCTPRAHYFVCLIL